MCNYLVLLGVFLIGIGTGEMIVILNYHLKNKKKEQSDDER